MFLAQTCQSFAQQTVNILIARYATDTLGVSAIVMGNIVGLYFGVALAMRPVAGPLITKLNKRNLLIFVYFTGGIVNLGYALFNTTEAFIAFRVIQGVQYSFMGSLTMNIAVDSLPKDKMTSGIAMYGLGGILMQTIGPNFGLWLRDLGSSIRSGAEGVLLGYKIAFFFASAMLAVAVIPLFLIKYDEKRAELVNTDKWYKTIISKHAIPMALVVLFANAANSGYRSFLDPFANEVGIPNIGLFSTTTAIVMLCTRPMSGRIMDRVGVKKVLPPGMAILALALVIISRSTTLPMVLVGAALSALGSGIVLPGLQSMCVQTETASRRAVATNTLYAGIDTGNWIGPIWGGIVVSSTNYSTAILAGIAPLLIALAIFLFFIKGFTNRLKTIAALEKGKENQEPQ
ncbi:MAG: MFS transporter [Oscillospiraceae bacterium]|nr:MFS transporter [Oscillospiraceae bacterium]